MTQIGDLAARNADKLIILACHHPFKSNGPHGGFFTLKQHLFPFTDLKKSLYIPLPVIGSAYPIARSIFGSVQDMSYPAYSNMIERISTAVKMHTANVVFVAGHDHNLQLIREDGTHYIVSGGGCKQNRTSRNSNTLFNSIDNGFVVLETTQRKDLFARYYTVTDSVRMRYETALLNFSKRNGTAKLPEPAATAADPALQLQTIRKPASENTRPVHGLKKYFMGQNYRREWSTPVQMKVLQLATEKGGLKIESIGGGQETRSLRVEDATGKEWVLRSLRKDPRNPVPENSFGTVLDLMAEEMKTGAHPYAALAVPPLAEALNLLTAHPEIVYVPDDPALGMYRPLFANTVCLLEERNTSKDEKESRTTAKIFNNIIEDNDHRADQDAVLTARLLDILLGDYDRHFDQWRWGVIDSAGMKGKLYYPIPRDRDKVFFSATGKMFRLSASREWPYLKGFRNEIARVNWTGYTARDFDRFFLNRLTLDDWKKNAEMVQQKLTDSVLRNAVQQMPPEITALSGDALVKKLISRRNLLLKEATDYYRFLNHKVQVTGSNQKEYFKISPHPQGLQVRVYEKPRNNDTGYLVYDRVFDPLVTKEIRLFGLNDEDYFEIEKDVHTPIRIRIIGGRGYDTFDLKGQATNYVYDLNSDQNYFKNSTRTKKRLSADPPAGERSILGHQYNETKFPLLQLGYNSDDGLLTGAGISKRTYGFVQHPYSVFQQLSALYAASRNALQLHYQGEFNHVAGRTDLLLTAGFSSPALHNFTGFGNKTTVNHEINFDFYRVRYRSADAAMMLRRRPFEHLQLMIGPWYQSYQNKYSENKNSYLAQLSGQPGFDSANIFSTKKYAGAKIVILLDNRNNTLFPTRGIRWHNELLLGSGLNNASRDISRLSSDMTLYMSRRSPATSVLVLGFGGTKILSRSYEFFQAASLGFQNSNLHGFRKNRFLGKSSLYASAEWRVKLFTLQTWLLPGPFGFTGFADAGRVWQNAETSSRWHTAFGGGFYFIPFHQFIVTATAGFLHNERLLSFSIGSRMTLPF